MSTFFVSCQPGLEKDLVFEIESFWHMLIDLDGLPTRSRPEFVDQDITGGIELRCDIHLGYQINLFSKLGNRVLLRLTHFSARFFDQFEKEIKKIKLKDYFGDQPFAIQVDASKSRLFHEKNLLESAYKAFGLKDNKATSVSQSDDGDEFQLYIRIFKDEATLSIDTTGRHLHKRGYRVEQGAAPIRETLAAKVYFKLLELAYSGQLTLFERAESTALYDPFCGSGTLLFESACFKLPSLNQSFSFEKFLNRPALMKSNTWKKNYKISYLSQLRFYGSELDPQTFQKLNKNKNEFLNKYPQIMSDYFTFLNCDSSLIKSAQFKEGKIILMTNPPYGERLDSNTAIDVLNSVVKEIQPYCIAVIHPLNWNLKYENYRAFATYDFDNQGLKLKLSFFKKS